MVEALVTVFVGICLLIVGGSFTYAATREPVPMWLKERRGLFRNKYDIPDESARIVPLIAGVFVAMLGLAALFLGVAMLAGVVKNS